MTVEEVNDEVLSVFCEAMGNRKDFPFSFLQSTGCGSRCLTVPSVSSAFQWTAQQVAKLGGSKQPIYILAGDKLMEACEVSVLCIHFISAATRCYVESTLLLKLAGKFVQVTFSVRMELLINILFVYARIF